MPTLHRLQNCKIEMRSRDHRPAHVHVLMSDGREVLVYLDDLRTEAREKVRRAEIAAALAWIRPRVAELAQLFEELQT
jgi:hypothetical protein